MYVVLLYILKKKTDVNEATNKKKKSMAKMIQGVVICLVICNLPTMIWILWWGEMLKQGTEEARRVVAEDIKKANAGKRAADRALMDYNDSRS